MGAVSGGLHRSRGLRVSCTFSSRKVRFSSSEEGRAVLVKVVGAYTEHGRAQGFIAGQ